MNFYSVLVNQKLQRSKLFINISDFKLIIQFNQSYYNMSGTHHCVFLPTTGSLELLGANTKLQIYSMGYVLV